MRSVHRRYGKRKGRISQALELWAAKVDSYLANHSLADLRRLLVQNHVEPTAINSIEFIGFRGAAYPQIREALSKAVRDSGSH